MAYCKKLYDEYEVQVKSIDGILDTNTNLTNDELTELVRERTQLTDKMMRVSIEIDKNDLREKELANGLKTAKNTGEVILEWAKLIIPVIIPIIAYDVFQKRVLKYEETGSICSSAGRQLHLPRFFK